MEVKTVRLKAEVPGGVQPLVGSVADDSHYSMLLNDVGPCKVYGPQGNLVCCYLPGVLAGTVEQEQAYEVFHSLRNSTSDNRGSYSVGNKDLRAGDRRRRNTGVVRSSPGRVREVKADGTLSRQTRSRDVRSIILGHFDRGGRHDYCRKTSFTANHPDEWDGVLPLVRRVAALQAEVLPLVDRTLARAAAQVPGEYLMGGTNFSTVTLNNSVAAGYHRDKGNWPKGTIDGFPSQWGALSYYRRGSYSGGILVLPRYGVALDAQEGDLLFNDNGQVHGMTPVTGDGPETLPEKGGWERISVVYYLRHGMLKALPPARELARVRRRAEQLAVREEWT